MTKDFKVTSSKPIENPEEFCRMCHEGLTYVGQFVDSASHEVYRGSIIEYKGQYFSTEEAGMPGMCSCTESDGTHTTTLSLFETNFKPFTAIRLENCVIRVEEWNTAIDDEGYIGYWAFPETQFTEARELVKAKENSDLTIKVHGMEVTIQSFLHPKW